MRPGAHQYDLTRHTKEPNKFVVNELWVNQEAVNAHNATPELAAVLKESREQNLLASIDVSTYTRVDL